MFNSRGGPKTLMNRINPKIIDSVSYTLLVFAYDGVVITVAALAVFLLVNF